ncbi:MAG: hypothetical protein AB7V46_18575 [Thermomicrobiales bacterium]
MMYMGMKRVVGVFALLAMLSVAALAPGGASAQTGSSMLIRAFICPAEYLGSNWANDCEPLPDVEASFFIDASEYGFTEQTDSDGQAYFEVQGTGPFVAELGVPGDFAEFMSLCGEVGGTEPGQVEGANTNRLILDVQDGKDYYCSFYVSPVDARGEVAGEPVDQLPSTGAGVMEEHSGLATVALLIAAAVLLGGLGMLTTREELFDRK